MHQRYAHIVALAAGPRDGLFQSFDNALADRLSLSSAGRLLVALVVFFAAIPDLLYAFLGYPATRTGINLFIAFRSPWLRFSFLFFAYAESRNMGSRSS